MAHSIAELFPHDMRAFHEVFLGSGAVIGTLAPARGFGSDVLKPLMQIWQQLKTDPEVVKAWYASRRSDWSPETKIVNYERVRQSFNTAPNGADLLYLSRTCYGGVVRFRKADGHMSTPCGAHAPMSAEKFAVRVDEWARRTHGTTFSTIDFRQAIERAEVGDVVYCDPPYSDSQSILYGAQTFDLRDLVLAIDRAKTRGVRVALSIDGSKKSGLQTVLHDFPEHLFEAEVAITVGRSMLRRFQMRGQSLESEVVKDRLLLTYSET